MSFMETLVTKVTDKIVQAEEILAAIEGAVQVFGNAHTPSGQAALQSLRIQVGRIVSERIAQEVQDQPHA